MYKDLEILITADKQSTVTAVFLLVVIIGIGFLHQMYQHHCNNNDDDEIGIKTSEMKSKPGLCRVVTYNILADGYATSGLHDMSYCSAKHLSWEYRSKRILAELKLYDADILGLQEVEEGFAVGVLKTFLETMLGYQAGDFILNH